MVVLLAALDSDGGAGEQQPAGIAAAGLQDVPVPGLRWLLHQAPQDGGKQQSPGDAQPQLFAGVPSLRPNLARDQVTWYLARMTTERGPVPPVEFRTDTEASPASPGGPRRMWLKAVAYLNESWLLRAQGECIFRLDDDKNRRR